MNPIQIVVGSVGGPVAGTTDWNASALAGVEGYLQKNGLGIVPFANYTLLTGGGIHLNTGVFIDADVYFLVPTGITYATPSSNYTNGFNYAAVITALFGRIGWRNSTVTAYAGLAAGENLTARSQRYFNDFHALVALPNIKNAQEDPAISDSNFNAWLSSLQRSVIMRCVNGVLNANEYIEQVLLFDRQGYNDLEIQNTGQFVGFEINIAKDNGIAVQIDGAILQFNEDVTFNLYLFKDGKKSPIWVHSVSAVAFEQTQVNFADLILTYINSNTRGARFYFGYFQSDLGTAKAIREQITRRNKTYCFSAEPVYMKKNVDYTFNSNQRAFPIEPYGLNLEMSSFKDWTQAIIKKPSLFDELIGLTMAYVALELIVNSVRSNGTERILKDVADKYALLFAMDGAVPVSDTPQVSGLKQRIDRELKRVKAGIIPQKKSITINVAECR